MKYYISNENQGAYLVHHGVKGQKKGIRQYQYEDGSLTPLGREHYGVGPPRGTKKIEDKLSKLKIKTANFNLNKYGSDADHNILFITGLSGSGKSTLAQDLRDKTTDVIHLDLYLEQGQEDPNESQRFNKFLSGRNIDFRNLHSLDQQERWKMYDKIEQAIDDFGKEEFRHGRNVIVEGVQLSDMTLYPDKAKLSDKPFIIAETSYLKSIARAGKRDDIQLYDIPTWYIRARHQGHFKKSINQLKSYL